MNFLLENKLIFFHLQSSVKSSLYPGTIPSLLLTEAVVVAAEKNKYDLTMGLVDKLIVHFPKYVFCQMKKKKSIFSKNFIFSRNSVEYRLICAALMGLAGWAGMIFSVRQVMKLLLRYHGNKTRFAYYYCCLESIYF